MNCSSYQHETTIHSWKTNIIYRYQLKPSDHSPISYSRYSRISTDGSVLLKSFHLIPELIDKLMVNTSFFLLYIFYSYKIFMF